MGKSWKVNKICLLSIFVANEMMISLNLCDAIMVMDKQRLGVKMMDFLTLVMMISLIKGVQAMKQTQMMN